MTGLDLESFLELLRADLGAWASLGLVLGVLALMTWTSWGSRRALRKCLVLSIGVHVGLIIYGSTQPVFISLFEGDVLAGKRVTSTERRVRVAPVSEVAAKDGADPSKPSQGRTGRNVAAWDVAPDLTGMVDTSTKDLRPKPELAAAAEINRSSASPLSLDSPAVDLTPVTPNPSPSRGSTAPLPPTPALVAPGDGSEVTKTAPKTGLTESNGPDSLIGLTRPRPNRVTRDGTLANEPSRPQVSGLPSLPDAPIPVVMAPGAESSSRRAQDVATPVAPSPSSTTEIATSRPMVATREGASGNSLLPERNFRNLVRPSPSNSETLRENPGRVAAAPLGPIGPTTALDLPATTRSAAVSVPGAMTGNSGTDTPVGLALDPAQAGPSVASPIRPSTSSRETLPEANSRQMARPDRGPGSSGPLVASRSTVDQGSRPLSLSRVAPDGTPNLPIIQGGIGLTRPLTDIPSVYRSRLDPNRTAIAQKAGATRESEQAVERALNWLAQHQDADGRWDGGTARYKDGSIADGDDDFTIHCPPGDVCFGPCYYWEGDTALTGLSLLAYLGSGYTHTDGKYAETVGKGLEYLRLQQKPDGDLRGRSVAVGMYCHAMATLALCEAYALTGDPKLRVPVERAVAFLIRSRATDGMAWRYAPGAPVGDTSILGWVVMVLKSAKEVGIPIPPNTRQGVTTWLTKVSAGPNGGLAKYQPFENVTPTMTAEAWVCRQFLETGEAARTSSEAADYLLDHGPNKGQFNLYYWYYGTLAMYQHGGESWSRWNREVREGILRRQRTTGHAAGSWDPDESQYGTHGGRIYCTALATLSLEVYYRYLRLYDAPASSLPAASRTGTSDAALRRTGQLP